MSDFIVTIEFKNKNADGELETVVEKEYDFINYTELLHIGLTRIIKEIEDAFYYFTDEEQKENWDPEAKRRFSSIRHKLLDEANAIKRLPNTLSYKGIKANQISINDFINQSNQ